MAALDFTSFYESAVVTSTTADAGADVVYTVPSSHDAQVTLLIGANGGSTHTFSIQVYHADTTLYSYILRAHSVSGGESYNVLGSSTLYLHAGDKVLAHYSAGTLDVSISGKQFYNPARS
tara:strand:+ start:4035 stop:4394 length:360 start_codon:yes stop_codon:yes gene_type:complete